MTVKHASSAAEVRSRVSPRRISPALIAWLIALVLCYIGELTVLGSKQTQLAISLIGLAHSVSGFWSDGGKRISAPGISFFASALFVYFPGAYLALTPAAMFYHLDLTRAITIVLVMQVLAYHLVWQYRRVSNSSDVKTIPPSVARPGMVLGLVFLAAGVGASFTAVGENPMVDALVYSGLVLYGVSALHCNRNALFSYLVIAAGFLIYLEIIFTGFGRLTIGSLGMALAMAATHRWSGRLAKSALIIGTAPVIAYMATKRVDFKSTMVSNVDSSVTGLESVLSPLARFSQLLDMSISGVLDHTWGESIYASAVVLIPRAIWPDKPVGLGAELGAMFRPDLSDSYSALALMHGEAVYGFGILGLLLLFPLFTWMVSLVDRLIVNSQTRTTKGLSDLALTTAGVTLAASIVDLTWGGTFTFASAVAPRLVLILGVYAIARLLEAARRDPGGSREMKNPGAHVR
ncbi:hypothetical protein [Arthrobacter castelli]|uniref:hypothetical protein n=1 Tax=Arthrobacter castelli TaxID=271431 RepID=UPI00040807E0|nr:hypothetical protein [Arthrobacter castelli]